ncbi:SGNH/GDSL hydrolase family protein [Nocardia cyriacigeorgica]|uniref:SGNH/GDSL hydrolase family protein n=1 Tax=Nocardia cyriacigeorgica TaxID=135487 RepID=UPI0024550677|nr:SGNH/GDSL hydrolase family protein [Nocardia cyriacigeorgica]
MTFANGGMDQSVAANLGAATQWGIRIPVKLFATPTRVRLKIRNYGMTNVSSVDLTGKGIIYGPHAVDGSGNSTGNFAGGTATTLVSGDFTIPGNGSYYYSPWFNLNANTDYLIGIGYTMASTAMKTTIGQCFIWNTSAAALNPATTGGTVPVGIPLDFQLEYELPVASSASAWLFIGDSIQEGVQGTQGTAASSIVPMPIHQSPPNKWAAANNVLVQNLSMAGITASLFANPAYPEFWTRQNIVAANLDGAIISLGSNDVFPAGRTLAQFQADLTAIVSKVRSLIGYDKPIYVGNIIPRNQNNANNNVRISVNNWLATRPLGITNVIDFDAVMRQGESTTTLNPVLTCDTIHPSFAGVDVLANRMTATVSTAAAVAPENPHTVLTQAQYDALAGGRDPGRVYVIVG